jgi:ATP-dependent Clp protease ATP-binding subunit ClpC
VFERYTERARRVLFFARYEASQTGSVTIETEHLLLGLLRESKGLTSRILRSANVDLEAMRRQAEARTAFKEKVSTSVEIPFTDATKRALQQAAVEADGLLHSYIGTEHLLLALLHDPRTAAGEVLAAHGLGHDDVRKEIVRLLNERAAEVSPGATGRVEVFALIQQIKRDVSQLASLADHGANADAAEVIEPYELADRIHRSLDRLKPQRDS